MKRFIATLIASVAVFAMMPCSFAAAAVPSKRLTASEKRFLDLLSVDHNVDNVDFTTVSDRELVAAGHAFCNDLKTVRGEGAREGTGGPTPDDFDGVAQQISSTRFSEVTKDILGRPSTNGDVLLAYSVGISAVKTLCPKYRSALG